MSTLTKSSAFDPMQIPTEERNPYPPPHDTALTGRRRRVLGDVNGLTKFGVNLTELSPGAVSALRHWHSEEDEFIYITEGRPTLITDTGEQTLQPGMCACFPAGASDAHRLENRTEATVRYLEVGNRSAGENVCYPDNDMVMVKSPDGTRNFTTLDGAPF